MPSSLLKKGLHAHALLLHVNLLLTFSLLLTGQTGAGTFSYVNALWL